MARYRYRPYRKNRRTGKTHNLRYFIIALMVIAVGVVILVKSRDEGGDELEKFLREEGVKLDKKKTEKKPAPTFQFKPEQLAKNEQSVRPEAKPVERTVSEQELQNQLTEKPILSASDGTISSEVVSLIADAHKDINAGRIIAARDKLNQALSMRLNPQGLASVKKKLADLSQRWLFSRDVYPDDTLTSHYTVQQGDYLDQIGKKFNVPYEILMKINNISDARGLQAGEIIKVVNGPFNVIVSRSDFTMDLYLGNNTYVKTYRIGLGAEDQETPTGRWKVKVGGKLIKPTWTDRLTGKTYDADHPEYPLGSRWIALDGLEGNAEGRTGFALHGTKDPETIGVRSSRGCIRLYNGDIIEVYDMMMPGLSEVLVVD